MRVIRWGIYGPGRIAHTFADAVTRVPDAEVVAVAGRTPEKAAVFARDHAVPEALHDLQALSAHPDVDAVYIATTHQAHFHAAQTCLQAGKAVLCEKPLVMNAQQADALIKLSRERSVFLMEAMWTRFLPVWRRVRALLAEGVIGDVRMVTAELGFAAPPDPQGRLLNKALAGGAILDIGVYTVSMTHYVLGGMPDAVKAEAVLGATGVDESMVIAARFPGACLAIMGLSLTCRMDSRFVVAGSKGHIGVPRPFHAAKELEWTVENEPTHKEHLPYEGNGFEGQIEEACRCIRAGAIESSIVPHADSLIVVRIMDEARRQAGLSYPADHDPFGVP